MLKKTFLLLGISLSFFSLSIAGVSAGVSALQQRTLVVVIESVTKSGLSGLNAEEQQSYQKAVENYNRKLKEVIERFWKLNAKTEFKTWDEVNEMIKQKRENALLLYAGNYPNDPTLIDAMIHQGLTWTPNIYKESQQRRYLAFYTAFNICELENFKKHKIIFSRTIANIWPLKEDMIFSCQYFTSLLSESKRLDKTLNVNDVALLHHDEIKSSTLLLNQDFLDEGVVLSGDKLVAYPYSVKSAEHDSILVALIEQRNVVYVEITPQMVGTGEAVRLGYEHVLINAATGMIVAYVPVDGGILHATMGHANYHKYISTGVLSKYLMLEELPVNPAKTGDMRE
jgi:hypothetical protein